MLNHLVLLAGLLYASYTDVKGRIVPDRLNYFMIAFGLLYHAHLSFSSQSLLPIALSLSGALIAFLFSYLLWRIGAWAGGDVKLFTAFGALAPGANLPIFPFVIFVNSIILSFPFIMLYVFYKTLAKKSLRTVFRKMLVAGIWQGIVIAALASGFAYLLPLLGFPATFSIPLTLLALFLPANIRHALALLLGIPGLIHTPDAPLLYSGTILATLFWQATSHGRKHVLRARIPVEKLREGMIAAETLFLSGKKVKVFSPALSQRLTLYEPPKTIISMYRAAGMEKSEIASLRRHGVKSVWTKESMPMVPVLFLGALSAIWLGSLISLLLEHL